MVSVANLIAICPIEMKVQRFGCHVQNPIHGIDERSNVDVFLTVLSSSLRNCYTSSMCDQSLCLSDLHISFRILRFVHRKQR